MDRSVLARKQLTELKDIAANLEMRGYQRLKKADLIDAIIAHADGRDVSSRDTGAAPGGNSSQSEGRQRSEPQGAGADRAATDDNANSGKQKRAEDGQAHQEVDVQRHGGWVDLAVDPRGDIFDACRDIQRRPAAADQLRLDHQIRDVQVGQCADQRIGAVDRGNAASGADGFRRQNR
jgi:hypothetical protein